MKFVLICACPSRTARARDFYLLGLFAKEGFKVFVSYRRADSRHIAARVCDWLGDAFGQNNVFRDVESIPLGSDFATFINGAIPKCSILVLVIGRQWLTDATSGRRRLNDSDDPVRMEIQCAQNKQIPILPLLVDGADHPSASSLPEDLRQISLLTSATVRDDPHFVADLTRVIKHIEREFRVRNQNPGAFADGPAVWRVTPGFLAVWTVLHVLWKILLTAGGTKADDHALALTFWEVFIILAIGQWALVHKYYRFRGGRWWLGTSLGWLFAAALGPLSVGIISDMLIVTSFADSGPVSALSGVIGGAILGCAQWLALRTFLPGRSAHWIWISALAYGISLMGSYAFSDAENIPGFVAWIVGVLGAGVGALVTGWNLGVIIPPILRRRFPDSVDDLGVESSDKIPGRPATESS